MKFYLNGSWQDRQDNRSVVNPFDGTTVDCVPEASADDVETAIKSALVGAENMRTLSAYQRFEILSKAAAILREQLDEMTVLLSSEQGKPLHEARGEVSRACETLQLSAEEAKRIGGELLPVDGGKAVGNQLAFTLRVPCGVVLAISPFNYPLNLVCHKVGPALAAGNSVIVKPATDTPLVALRLVEVLLQAGLPEHAINCLTGDGKIIGEALCRDSRIRKISFTGSRAVGEAITRIAGLKRVTMELGSNCPIVVLHDADLEKVASAIAASGYTNAGQVCLSAQRIIVASDVHDDLVDALVPQVESISVGDQLLPETRMGPMIREKDAARVVDWIDEAVVQGARVLTGGQRENAIVQPAILTNVTPSMRVYREELFGPAVSLLSAPDIGRAIALANDTEYGLSASVFTQDIDAAVKFARRVDSGVVNINWGTVWRADAMPFGGLKASGIGKEGPRYAIEEMTESKTVVIHTDG